MGTRLLLTTLDAVFQFLHKPPVAFSISRAGLRFFERSNLTKWRLQWVHHSQLATVFEFSFLDQQLTMQATNQFAVSVSLRLQSLRLKSSAWKLQGFTRSIMEHLSHSRKSKTTSSSISPRARSWEIFLPQPPPFDLFKRLRFPVGKTLLRQILPLDSPPLRAANARGKEA